MTPADLVRSAGHLPDATEPAPRRLELIAANHAMALMIA